MKPLNNLDLFDNNLNICYASAVNVRISKLADYIPPALLEKLIPKELFARLDIAIKMLIGYMILVLLTMVVIIVAPSIWRIVMRHPKPAAA